MDFQEKLTNEMQSESISGPKNESEFLLNEKNDENVSV
jgi:hypothetical protein